VRSSKSGLREIAFLPLFYLPVIRILVNAVLSKILQIRNRSAPFDWSLPLSDSLALDTDDVDSPSLFAPSDYDVLLKTRTFWLALVSLYSLAGKLLFQAVPHPIPLESPLQFAALCDCTPLLTPQIYSPTELQIRLRMPTRRPPPPMLSLVSPHPQCLVTGYFFNVKTAPTVVR